MSPETPNARELKAIIDWINVTDDIREFSLTYGDVQLRVSRNSTTSGIALQVPTAQAPQSTAPVALAGPKPVEQTSAAEKKRADMSVAADEVLIKAPMVGTFYAAPKPGQPDFVTVGAKVKPDTVMCIVEVMKLMNTLEAGVEGTVTSILVSNEQAVQYGQPLMIIKRS